MNKYIIVEILGRHHFMARSRKQCGSRKCNIEAILAEHNQVGSDSAIKNLQLRDATFAYKASLFPEKQTLPRFDTTITFGFKHN